MNKIVHHDRIILYHRRQSSADLSYYLHYCIVFSTFIINNNAIIKTQLGPFVKRLQTFYLSSHCVRSLILETILDPRPRPSRQHIFITRHKPARCDQRKIRSDGQLCDSLSCNKDTKVEDLAKFIQHHTSGNPLFISNSFRGSLTRSLSNFLGLMAHSRMWTWDLQQIRLLAVNESASMEDLVKSRAMKLSADAQNLLKLAAPRVSSLRQRRRHAERVV